MLVGYLKVVLEVTQVFVTEGFINAFQVFIEVDLFTFFQLLLRHFVRPGRTFRHVKHCQNVVVEISRRGLFFASPDRCQSQQRRTLTMC